MYRYLLLLIIAALSFSLPLSAQPSWLPAVVYQQNYSNSLASPASFTGQIRHDSFRVDMDTTSLLPVFVNDKLENIAQVLIFSARKGTVSVATGNTGINYTPDSGYKGRDRFAYQILTTDGFYSGVAYVDIEVMAGRAQTPVISPRGNLFTKGTVVEVKIESSPGADIYYELNYTTEPGSNKLPHSSGLIKYTGPFNVSTGIRVAASAKGEGYTQSPLALQEYVFLEEARNPSVEKFGWESSVVKVGQPAIFQWHFEGYNERSSGKEYLTCYNESAIDQSNKSRPQIGKEVYHFDRPQSFQARMYCNNIHGQKVIPLDSSQSHLTQLIQVQKLDAAANVNVARGFSKNDAFLRWDRVKYAETYKIEIRGAGDWRIYTSEFKGNWIHIEDLEAGTYEFRITACSDKSCSGMGEVTTPVSVTLVNVGGVTALNDEFSVFSGSTVILDVLNCISSDLI